MGADVQPFYLDTRLADFMPLPRGTLGTGLSSTAILLYALLVDRGTLSQKNGRADRDGQVYVIYPIAKLARSLGRGTTVVKRCLDELEKAGLIRRERVGRTAPSHIFLSLPTVGKPAAAESESRPSERPKSDRAKGGKASTNKRREQTDLANYYQHKEDESL